MFGCACLYFMFSSSHITFFFSSRRRHTSFSRDWSSDVCSCDVGPLRIAFIAHCAPLVRDVVLAGADRDDITALVFPDPDACRKLTPELAADAPVAAVLADPRVRDAFAALLDKLLKRGSGTSNRIPRAVLLAE